MSSESEAQNQFQRFIEQFKDDESKIKYELELSTLAPKAGTSLVVDFNDLYLFSPELAETVIKLPQTILPEFGYVATQKLRMREPAYTDEIKNVKVRIRKLPESILLRGLNAKKLGKLIMLDGIIVKMAKVLPFITNANFKCAACAEVISLNQEEETLQTPNECTGCGTRKGLTLIPDESTFVDSQIIVVQESPEKLPAGMLPTQIVVSLKEDLVDLARPGDLVSITGRMALQKKAIRGGYSRKFDFYVEANNIDVSSKEGELIELTPEDELKIIEMSKDPQIAEKLLKSVAPSLYGLEVEKEAILYHLFGGVREEREDGPIRGDIAVLFVGDPGTGKSKLQQYAVATAPRGLFTTGKGTSAAGLTAAVIRDEKLGGYILEAGTLVLGDLGHVAIDELDKMREEDRGALHTAMEQQIVPIAKGGIVATMNARTAITASANPTLGRYNSYQTIAQNISTFPIPLLNRFDLIFVLKDIPESVRDDKMADYILKLVDGPPDSASGPIEQIWVRKYLAYARANVKPVMTDEVRGVLKTFYNQMRAASLEGGEASAISITVRQLEALVRITKARAKVHLRPEVTIHDAECAIQIMTRSLEQVGIDPETGQFDIDILYTGKPRSLQIQLQAVLGVIGEMERIEGAVRDDDLYEAMSADHGIGRTEVARLIGVLMRDGTIFSPRPGYYQRTS